MKSEDIERAFLDKFKAALPTIRVDEPGEHFRPEPVPKEWIKPRIQSADRTNTVRLGEETEIYTLTVACYVKSQPKGKRRLNLSNLVDRVRDVIDFSAGASGIPIDDGALPTPVIIGIIQLAGTTEERSYGTSIDVNGVTVPGVDEAIITQDAHISGSAGTTVICP